MTADLRTDRAERFHPWAIGILNVLLVAAIANASLAIWLLVTGSLP
jgi:hypothetical protein